MSSSRQAATQTAEQHPVLISPDEPGRIPRDVLIKLLGFTIAIFALPLFILSFADNVVAFKSKTTGAVLAVIVVNLVLIAYIVVAFTEDDGSEDRKDARSLTPSSPRQADSDHELKKDR